MIQKTIKSLFISLVFLLLLLTPQRYVNAQEDKDYFDVDADVSYEVLEDTKTRVTQRISIKNKEEFVYAPSYAITLHLKNISNITARNASGAIPYTLKNEADDAKVIELDFPDKVVGVGSSNNFTFSFVSTDFAKKTGSILSINIPSLSGEAVFNAYTVHITVPSGYDSPSIVKPAASFTKSANTYTFSNNPDLKNGVELIFGDSQLYKFDLSYHLENNNVFPIRTEIALPPNTAYQEVLLENLTPKPVNVYYDQDGNVLAEYNLSPKTTVHVKSEVLIKISKDPKPQELNAKDRATYLKPQKYWEANDPEIKKIASGLKTPREIFDYVVKTLSYDTKKIDGKNDRLGAKNVLSKPYFAVCLEFTDLFIALSRAAGIPARALEGYAYTTSERDRPVSLFEDVLHAWPEYYDEESKTWIMVDPTWQNTTEGIDYFDSLDFDHVVFAINGAQSTYPVPAGGYKTDKQSKDIEVSFPYSVAFEKAQEVAVNSSFSSFASNGGIAAKLTLENLSNFELPSYPARVLLDGKYAMSVTFPKTPSFGKSEISVSIPLKNNNLLSLTNIDHTVTIQSEDGQVLDTETTRVFPFSQYLIIGGAIFIGLAFILILTLKTRGVSVQR